MEQFIEEMVGLDEANSIELLRESSIELKYSTSIHYECDGHVKDIDIKIIDNVYDEEREIEIEKELGTVKINMMRHMSWMDYQEAFDFCDRISQNFLDGFDACFKDENSKSKTKFSLEKFSEYVYIDLLKMNENNRGMGIGTAVIREIIDTLDKTDTLFVVLPFAIEDNENNKAHKRVKKFWENLGFKKMANSRFYYFNDKLMNWY